LLEQRQFALIDLIAYRSSLRWSVTRPAVTRGENYETVNPPSTAISAPVSADDAGEQSHVIAAAISIGSMSLPSGCCTANASPLSRPYTLADASRMAVRVDPGLTMLAVTP